ncbi:hypothetical protein [Pandoravirus japonicus]|uniref:Uncharacterized protein n=1 Tax=Pandoravirus japonicus TaxID=2823154 RepID=A0A811BSH1_9VIRU|nr:hypothetical protein [Pandoravirus japonicus]
MTATAPRTRRLRSTDPRVALHVHFFPLFDLAQKTFQPKNRFLFFFLHREGHLRVAIRPILIDWLQCF